MINAWLILTKVPKTLVKFIINQFKTAPLLAFVPACLGLPAGHGSQPSMIEPEYLRPYLRAQRLPGLNERVPVNPRVVNLAAMGRKPGRYGGTVRMIAGSQKDIRLMTIYGYSRLVGYDQNLNLQPDILESFDVQEGPHLHLQAARRTQMV